jgi:hypothetical protein
LHRKKGERQMYKARLTKSGARRIGCPELAGAIVEFEQYSKDKYGVHEGPGGVGRTVEGIYYQGRRIAGGLSYAGETPGLEIIE